MRSVSFIHSFPFPIPGKLLLNTFQLLCQHTFIYQKNLQKLVSKCQIPKIQKNKILNIRTVTPKYRICEKKTPETQIPKTHGRSWQMMNFENKSGLFCGTGIGRQMQTASEGIYICLVICLFNININFKDRAWM